MATNPSAPAANARCANTGFSSIVITTIFVSGARSRSRLIASMLDPPGMLQVEHQHLRLTPQTCRATPRHVIGLGDHFDAVLTVEQRRSVRRISA